LRKENPQAIRVVSDLSGADRIMKEALFVGTYPGLTEEMIEYVTATIVAFCRGR
jgi:CDP-6-deoxy-D-xylo-4-hexulose-3-dehydrase